MKIIVSSVLIVLSCFVSSFAQEEFSFKLYFEDAAGNKDTITIGYDENATNGIDATFGEENIITQQWDSVFEARVALGHFLYDNGNLEGFLSTDFIKKQIIVKNCGNNSSNIEYSVIQLRNTVFPLTIKWDREWFSDNTCTTTNFLTDWFPGCWFDCFVVGTEQSPISLNLQDSVVYDYVTLYNSLPSYNPTSLLFIALSDDQLNVLNTPSTNGLSVYPNPFDETFILSSELSFTDIHLIDLQGKNIDFTQEGNSISPINCSSGIYFLSVLFENNTKRQFYKIVKQ